MMEIDKEGPDSLTNLRIEQARILKDRAFASCLIVEFVILYTTALLLITGTIGQAIIWFGSATSMVLVTFAYARLMAHDGIGPSNFTQYLRGHILVSSLTGMVWSAFAIYQIDFTSEYTVFIACLIVSSITMGGVLPSSAYRPGYIGLSIFAILPLGVYLLLAAPSGFRLVGLGILVYFLFTMYISARVEIDTRETIASRNARALNEKVITQNAVIQKASEEKTRFLAATSHDLSQPIHAQGFFMQALRPKLNHPEQVELLDKIEDSWRAQRQLLQGIVDISRIDNGVIIPQHVPANLKTVAEKLADELTIGLKDKLILNTEFADISIQSDPVLLDRILRNILSNAQKYTPVGGHIDFRIHQEGDLAVIAICNSGPPIAERDQQRIFDEYVKLNNANSQDGLGLGLSIVRRLTELLNIAIDLKSSVETGTCFTLTLPIVESTYQDTTHSIKKANGFANMPLVVLVDDELAIRESMAAVFSSWNCQLITAASGSETLALVSRTSAVPALLVVDKRLANDENGLDLIEALREEVNEITPAILISGDLSDLEDTHLIPDVQLMNKPIDPDEILRVMTALLPKQHTVKRGKFR